VTTLNIRHDTLAKLKIDQSSSLTDREKVFVRSGTIFLVSSWGTGPNNHVRIALKNKFLGPENRNTWWFYGPHVELLGTWPDNNPKDLPAPAAPSGSLLVLPNGTRVGSNDKIIQNGNFSWGEATKNGTRRPINNTVVHHIIRIATAMEEVRSILGDRPITVNSWYRPPDVNRSVGGARDSRHMVGDAVDFTVQGLSPFEVQKQLDPWWGDRGGLASASTFTHIDARGVKARWRYGS